MSTFRILVTDTLSNVHACVCVCVCVCTCMCGGEAKCNSDSPNYVEWASFSPHEVKYTSYEYWYHLRIATVSAPAFYRSTLPVWTWSWWWYACTRNCCQPYNLFTSNDTSTEFSLLCKEWEHNCCKPYFYCIVRTTVTLPRWNVSQL